MKRVFAGSGAILLAPALCMPVYANMIWPSLYIRQGLLTWWLVAVGLIVECIVLKCLLKEGWAKTALMAVVMNTVSAAAGVLVIPLVGIAGEFALYPLDTLLGLGTFSPPHWVAAFVLAVLCNTVIEGLVLKIGFHRKFRDLFWWLLAANGVSVVICAGKLASGSL